MKQSSITVSSSFLGLARDMMSVVMIVVGIRIAYSNLPHNIRLTRIWSDGEFAIPYEIFSIQSGELVQFCLFLYVQK